MGWKYLTLWNLISYIEFIYMSVTFFSDSCGCNCMKTYWKMSHCIACIGIKGKFYLILNSVALRTIQLLTLWSGCISGQFRFIFGVILPVSGSKWLRCRSMSPVQHLHNTRQELLFICWLFTFQVFFLIWQDRVYKVLQCMFKTCYQKQASTGST